jgi:hypothetical protein
MMRLIIGNNVGWSWVRIEFFFSWHRGYKAVLTVDLRDLSTQFCPID